MSNIYRVIYLRFKHYFCYFIKVNTQEKKWRNRTQSYEKIPYIDRKLKKAMWQHKIAPNIRLHNDCGPTKDGQLVWRQIPKLMWLNEFVGSQSFHLPQKLCNQKDIQSRDVRHCTVVIIVHSQIINCKRKNKIPWQTVNLHGPDCWLQAHFPVMCEIEISNCRKINLIIAYCFIFVLREKHLENAFD